VAISAANHWRKLCGSVAILPLRLLRYLPSIYFEDEPEWTHGPNCSLATKRAASPPKIAKLLELLHKD
jgi:hypothetical protein